MKRLIGTILGLILSFIIITFTVAFFTLNNGSFLTSFHFKSITNTGLVFYVYLEDVKVAEKYDIIAYNKENEVIYKDTIKENNTKIEFDELKFNNTYKIVAIAYDKEGNKKSVKEPYTFIWNELTFSNNNMVLMDNDNDYNVYFIGDYKKKDYKLNIKENGIYKETIDITKDEYTIKNKEFKDEKKYYTLEILDDNIVISTMNIYNLMTPISDISIINPSEGDMKDYNDISIAFEGGDNASNYILELYQGENLIRRKEIKSKNVVLSNNLFEKSASYTVKITASYYDYLDYSKTSEVNFTINDKETLKPVYTKYNPSIIKQGTEIELLSKNKNAKIYYTIDGSDPKENGNLYEDKIIIKNNTTVKAYAKEDKKNDSIVSTFDFKIGTKNKYKVYLSASNQTNNLGVREVGYTNEEREMNDLTNYIEERLNDFGVITYRNEFGDINRWTADSTYLGVDLHLAIHSNASEDHTAYGIETWIHQDSSETYSLAQNIQNNLMGIYYNQEDELADRGVKYANGSLAEVKPTYVPFGILLEVAHHDYISDAKWIMENKKKIGYSIADTILDYYQIK